MAADDLDVEASNTIVVTLLQISSVCAQPSFHPMYAPKNAIRMLAFIADT